MTRRKSTDPAFHRAQRLNISASPGHRDLCMDAPPHAVVWTDAGLRIEPEHRVAFDRLFNVFYEAYWLRQVAFDATRLTLRYEGSGKVAVHRKVLDATGHTNAIELATVELRSGASSVELTLAAPRGTSLSTPGMLSFAVTTDAGLTILGGEWSIDAAPRRTPRLTLVTCTTRYDEMMPGFFSALERAAWDNVASVIVVNNNASSFDAQLASRFPETSARLTVINQSNEGGTGGFTRGLLEAERLAGLTHVAFLDDDILLPDGLLERLGDLLAFVKDDAVVGGQMLDLRLPHVLSSSGEFFDTSRAMPTNPYGEIDLRAAKWEMPFLREHRGQWNGWWLCVYPATIGSKIGYPLPLFLKWDDIEYGVRASRAGLGHVTFPGIAVWHEPFRTKIANWDGYFNARNGLVTRALLCDDRQLKRSQLVARVVAPFAWNLLTYRYVQCELILLGCRDYRAGPDAIPADASEHLSSLRRVGTIAPEVTFEGRGSRQLNTITPIPDGLVSLLRSLLWNLWSPLSKSSGRSVVLNRQNVGWRTFYGRDVAYIDDQDYAQTLVYRRRPHRARKLFVQFIAELVRLYGADRQIASNWRAAQPHLTSRTQWEQRLRMGGKQVPTVQEAVD